MQMDAKGGLCRVSHILRGQQILTANPTLTAKANWKPLEVCTGSNVTCRKEAMTKPATMPDRKEKP